MSLQQSYIALDWVKDALEETLQKVQSELLQQTPVSLQSARDSLHQVSGTLHIAQLNDTLILSEALEKVLLAVSDGRIQLVDVQTAVIQTLTLLSEEFNHLQKTKSSRSAVIAAQVDVLNRLLPNESIATQRIFVPDLTLLDQEFVAQPRTAEQYEQLTRAYQYLLTEWLAGHAVPQTLLDFTRVSQLLESSAQTRLESVVWHVASVFHHVIETGALTAVDQIRSLLMRLERTLVLGTKAEPEHSYALLGDLLHVLDPQHIASLEVAQLRQLYGMDLPELGEVSNRLLDSALQQVIAARDGLVVSRDTAAIALREAVRLLDATGWYPLAQQGKAQLEQLIAEYHADPKIIEQLTSDLNTFADQLKQTIELTAQSAQSNKTTDEGAVQEARHAAVRESRTALEKIKVALAHYHQSRGDIATLATVPDLLKMVSGAFTVLALFRAADLLSHTVTALNETILKAKYVPHWKQTDLLAQLISSIEYYLDQLAGHYQDDNILAFAEQTLKEFKKPHGEPEPMPVGGEKLFHDDTSADVIDHLDVQGMVKDKDSESDIPVLQDVISQSDSSENPYGDDFDQDDEIREIFIEEAGEVLETIARDYPKWKSDFKDEASLREVRRAFHTLKGSGRMVGARSVGELAWAIESLLNRVLDNSVRPHVSMTRLIDEVYAGIPALVEGYKERRANSPALNQQIAAWVTTADALIHTRPVAEKPVHHDQQIEVDSDIETATQDDRSEKAHETESSASLPIHLLGEQAPKTIPADDFASYFGGDDFILETFLEEAGEVLHELNEHFPQWAANFENEAALKIIRRNFHTLKGSGRMVGAHALAELAWSIERLLNGILDHSVVATQNIVQLLGDVVAILPSLVEDFSIPRAPRVDLLPIVHAAWLLKAGHPISAAQIQTMMHHAVDAYSDIPLLDEQLDDEHFVADDFDALAQALNDQDHALSESVATSSVSTHQKQQVSVDEVDPQLLEIFIGEVEGYLADIRQFVKTNLVAGHHQVLPTDVLLRALHTLRGSAGMTGIQSIYQLAHAMEHECKRLMREHVAMTDAHLDALVDLDRLMTTQINMLKAGIIPAIDAQSSAFIQRIEALAPQHDTQHHEPQPVFTGLVTELMDIGIDDVLDAEWTLKDRLSEADALAHVATLNTQLEKLAQAVVHVPMVPLVALVTTLQQVYQHLLAYPAILDKGRVTDRFIVDDLLAGHETLTRMFDALAASIRVQPDESVLERLNYWQQQTPVQQVEVSVQPSSQPLNDVPVVDAARVLADHEAVQHTAALDYPVDRENEPELLDVFMEEAEELVQAIDQSFTHWTENTQKNDALKALQRHLHTLKGGARMARVASLGDYTHELETIYERLVNDCQQVPTVLVRFLRHAQDQVAQQVEQLGQSHTSFFTPTETLALQQYIKSRDVQVLQDYFDLMDSSRIIAVSTPATATPVIATAIVSDSNSESNLETASETAPKIGRVAEVAHLPQVETSPVLQPAQQHVSLQREPKLSALGQMQVLAETWDEGSAPDPDVLDIFLDEAGEIIDLTSIQLTKWLKGLNQATDDPNHKKLLQDLQRNLHTFKGGARMAGVDSLGDLSHEMEFVYEDLALGKKAVSNEIGQLLNQSHDWLADAIAVLDRGERPQMPTALIDALRLFRKDPALFVARQTTAKVLATNEQQPSPAAVATPVETPPVKQAKKVTVQATPQTSIATQSPLEPSALPPMTGSFLKKHESEVSSTEMVRVSANLMEKMINLAGENAISRARIEMELTGFSNVVDEMELTIQKIAEQLRRMDVELESQIIARHQDEISQHGSGRPQDFDPLEMDQYSSINQLSKSLAEAVSDLMDFKNTLVDKSRNSESLLLQQSRIQTELQEGLMSSRSVPFSRLVPRLQRVVRQTATELGKQVELLVLNAEGELDRSMLERMIAPLEHMLRNAVDHGIESSANRAIQKKPEKGTVTLSVLREGSEVIITLQDDGGGINVGAVRRKAIERGIIDATSTYTDTETMQLIFHAGLSTAAQVTQISGRGVGMDVVQSEIRQLGGVVTVNSVAGKGTSFTIHLPLTVAVTDALHVRVADRIFAVSLSQIERIVRVNTSDLERFYESNKETFNIDGVPYRLHYLGELISGTHTPTLYGQNMPSPLLLIKYEGQRFAIQVDQLIGSREEIVIKPVGLQLASVGSISGATILGDGSVVIILDLVALARSAGSVARLKAKSPIELKAPPVAMAQKHTIMVVDDSVTVRKVTTRLLERHGYQVIQAKDGVDAMNKLEDIYPDLMLLDIEMPRMDGFEVATLIRHSPRLSYLPIIMITSRTGEKHRERAYNIGVNSYMGKPFQEQVLLENISDLLLEARAGIANKSTA